MNDSQPLTRRELRLRTQTSRQAAGTPSAPSQPEMPPTTAANPVVTPPAAAAAMRSLDHTGRLAPAQEVTAAPVVPVPATPAPGKPPAATPSRRSIKDSVAAAPSEAAPPSQPLFPSPSPFAPVADRPAAPASIPPGGMVNQGAATPEEEKPMPRRRRLSDEELAAYRPSRYTWLHFLILIVVAFVLGVLAWVILDDGVDFLPGIDTAPITSETGTLH